MLLGIFLLDRRRKEIVLCIVINHGFSQDFVIAVSFCRRKMIIHESRDLIHI